MPVDNSSTVGRRGADRHPKKKEKTLDQYTGEERFRRSFTQVAIGALNAYNRFHLAGASTDTADESFDSGESFDQSDAGRTEHTDLSRDDESIASSSEGQIIGVQLVGSEDEETIANYEGNLNGTVATECQIAPESPAAAKKGVTFCLSPQTGSSDKNCPTRRDRMVGMQHLIAEMSRLKTQIDAEVEDANGVMEVLELNLDTVKAENRNLIKRIDLLTEQAATFESQKKELLERVEEMNGKITLLGEERDLLQSSLDEKDAVTNKLEERVEEMNGKINSLDGEKATLQYSLEETRVASIRLEKELQQKQHQLLQLYDAKSVLESQLTEKDKESIKLAASLQDCRSDAEGKALEIEKLTEANASLRENVSLLQVTNDDLQQVLSSNKSALTKAEDYIASLKEEVSWSKLQIVDLLDTEKELIAYKESAKKQLKSLQNQLTKVETQLEDAKTKNTSLEEQKLQLEEAVVDLNDKIAKLSTDNEHLSCTVQEKALVIDNLKSELEEAVDLTAVLEVNLNAADTDKQALRMQLSTLSTENAALLSSLDEKCMESFKLERSNEEKQQDVLKLSAAKKDLESNLKRNDEELSHFEAKVEEMQLQMTMMREELCKMTEVKSALESMLTRKEEENVKLAACLEEARSDSDEKNSHIHELMEEIELNETLLDDANTTIISLRKEVEVLKVENKSSTENLTAALQRIATMSTENATHRSEKHDLQQNNEGMHQQITTISTENARLQSDKQGLQEAAAGMRLQIAEMSTENAKLLSERRELQVTVDDVRQEITTMSIENATLLSSLDEKCMESFKLERSNEEKQHTMQEQTLVMSNLQSEVVEANEWKEVLELSLDAVKTDNRALSEEIEGLNAQIDAVEEEKNGLQVELDAVNEQLTVVTEHMKEAKSKNASLEEQNIQLEEAVVDLNDKIAKLSTDNEHLSCTVQEKSLVIDNLKSELEEANDLTAVLEVNLNAANTDRQALRIQLSTMSTENKSLLSSLDEKCMESFNLERIVEKKEEQISKLRSNLEGKEEDNVELALALQAALSHSDSKSLDIDKMTEEINLHETLHDEASATIAKLRKEVESVKSSLNIENATLLSTLDEKCIESFLLHQICKEKEKQILKLTNEKERLESEVEERRNENAVLLSSLDAKCIESFEFERSLDETKQQVSMMTEQTDALESMLNMNEKRAIKLEETLRNSRFDSKNKTREIERLAEELASNKAALKESNISVVTLKQEVSSSKNQIVELSDTTHKLEKSGKDLVEKVSTLLSDNEDLSNLVQVKTSFIEILESKLQEANSLKTDLEDNLNAVKEDNQALSNKIELLTVQIDKVEAERQDIVGRMNGQVATLEVEKHDLTDKLNDANKQISKLSSEKATIKSLLDVKIAENDNLEQINEEKQQQMKKLSDEITKVTATKGDLEAVLLRKEEEFVLFKQNMTESNRCLSEQINLLTEQVATVETEKRGLWESSEEMREKLATVSSDKASLQTKLGKNALANEELEKSAKKKQQQISTLIEARGNLESVLKVKQEQVIKLEKALEQAQANEEEVTFHIKEVNSKYRKLELDYAASVEKVELFELVISQKDKVASDLLEALKEMMSSSDERDEELAVLTYENNELGSKLDEANVKISRMHSKMQGLRMERNNAIARMQGLISGNSSLLETKVKEVSTRLDAEFAELQQRVESLDADMAELKSKNKCLEKENAVLRDSKKVAEERIAALEEAKVKRVKFSATCAPPAAGGPFGNGGKIRPISPASSYTSSSGFFDAEVAEQVAKALELAKQKLNKDKGSD